MAWFLGGLVVFGASAIMIVAMLLVRRHAPEGRYFADGDRAGLTILQLSRPPS